MPACFEPLADPVAFGVEGHEEVPDVVPVAGPIGRELEGKPASRSR